MDALENVNSTLRDLDKQMQAIMKNQRIWSEAKEKLIRAKIISEQLLRQGVWTVRVNGKRSIVLYGGTRQGFDELRNLIETDYHCHFELTPKITLHFSDGELYMTFDESIDVGKFVKAMDLNILIGDIRKEKERMRKALDNLNAIIDMFTGGSDGRVKPGTIEA